MTTPKLDTLALLPNCKNVSRETFLQLEHYVALLQKWNKTINLVGKSTTPELWQRHIADSLQLLPLIPTHIAGAVDLGSGAGLPGLIIAIALPTVRIQLVERDQRKAAFLQEAVAQLALKNVVIDNREIYCVRDKFALVVARALASLDQLCEMACVLTEPGALCLFPKGKNFAKELALAEKKFTFTYHLTPSRTEVDSSIISITKLSPRIGIV